ncbi:uncharacterized protein LOC129741437 [Uranotaenia lowii]|uniref:uncharacterized protein LOC129741437 n=1 Tax=Uranotaenia lowii TaxID=190385 RepID=UPI00247B2145|nr:uncharacterized protein LOC129741437 [Uranotaenia lowii]
MLSNWKLNANMANMNPDRSKQSSLHMMGSHLNKQLLRPFDGNGTTSSSAKNFSTLPLGGLVGHIFQKLTSILLPPDPSSMTLEKSKQSLSAPDIYHDHNINTPVFEAVSGRTKLFIPGGEETVYENTRSLSAGSSPFDWCEPFDAKSLKMQPNVKKGSKKQKHSKVRIVGKEIHLGRKGKKCKSSPNRSNKPCPNPKNFKEKYRHNLMDDIMDDLVEIYDSEIVSDMEADEELSLPEYSNYGATFVSSNLNEDFKQTPECESEESFVVFTDDIQYKTPSASPRKSTICATINSFFIPAAAFGRRQTRQRQISECSDDSIVFCYDDQDEPPRYYQTEVDLSTDEEDGDTDEETTEDESDDTLSHQPDSGFEEKKVRFNPNPEVHVMRQWDFAYRQARKGEWEMAARDRERFRKRIDETENILRPLFDSTLRRRIYEERYAC